MIPSREAIEHFRCRFPCCSSFRRPGRAYCGQCVESTYSQTDVWWRRNAPFRSGR